MLRRQTHVLSQSTVPFACTLISTFSNGAVQIRVVLELADFPPQKLRAWSEFFLLSLVNTESAMV